MTRSPGVQACVNHSYLVKVHILTAIDLVQVNELYVKVTENGVMSQST